MYVVGMRQYQTIGRGWRGGKKKQKAEECVLNCFVLLDKDVSAIKDEVWHKAHEIRANWGKRIHADVQQLHRQKGKKKKDQKVNKQILPDHIAALLYSWVTPRLIRRQGSMTHQSIPVTL